MSTQDLHSGKILKKALFELPQGMPVSARHLKEFGISRQLSYRYVKYGWLVPLGYGYFLRTGDRHTEEGAVASLQENGVKVHIGGKSALVLKGFAHYLSPGGNALTLYGCKTRKLPDWFVQAYRVHLSNSSLFDEPEPLSERLEVARINDKPHAPYASSPERAVLELLDQVPGQHSLEESRLLMESLLSLRSKKVQRLLEACKKVKVKRLFWQVAQELSLPVLKKLDKSLIDFGSHSDYTLSGAKALVLKNPHG